MKRMIRASALDQVNESADKIDLLETKIQILEEDIASGDYFDEDELMDMQEQLLELKDELRFAYAEDEAAWDYARQAQEFNPDGSLKYYP